MGVAFLLLTPQSQVIIMQSPSATGGQAAITPGT